QEYYQARVQMIVPTELLGLQRSIALHYLDVHWREHLSTMEYLRQSMYLRGYAQKDPKQEYKREAFVLFNSTLATVYRDAISGFLHLRPEQDSMAEEVRVLEEQRRALADQLVHPKLAENISPDVLAVTGRNDPCPCGSKEKYKHCHGQLK
ncbi:MAG: SEC-C metal-binding domain-containing protein, partial [Pseudomonadota bacterium]